MSEIQRVALHSAPRSRKEKEPPARSARLNVELGASNEDQYPEISYRDLIAAHLRKSRTENGKRAPAGPLSDNEDDVAHLAKQFEQKYGSLSTYGRSRKSKRDEFADIGAGYDENDSFIDNTDGYDEMCPPGYDTIHGGFYINCGSLEFKNVMDETRAGSDSEQITGQRSNKRRISSSSSEESSSESSSDSESGADKNQERVLNGEREPARRNKDKSDGKKKGKKRRTDASSAATSGKQTSDDNGHAEGDSADSRTSHTEDSLTSKPAPSSENAVTSDSSREVSDVVKPESKLPPVVSVLLDELSACVARLKRENSSVKPVDMDSHTDPYILRLEQALGACGAELRCRRAAWAAAARALSAPRTRLLHRARALAAQPPRAPPAPPAQHEAVDKLADPCRSLPTAKSKGSPPEPMETVLESAEPELTPEQRERQITDILNRLRTMIEARKPEMIGTYKAECERVQIANKKIAAENLAVPGARVPERRLPKRRYPWCGRTRTLLARLVRLCGGGAGDAGGGGDEAAARLLAHRVLPMFPPGFVRLPTLLRQANLNKDLKVTEIKKQKIPTPGHIISDTPLPGPITITTVKPTEKTHEVACGTSDSLKLNGKPPKSQAQNNPGTSSQKSTYNSIFSSFTLSPSTEVFLEKNKHEKDDHRKDTVTVEKVPEIVKVTADKPSKVDDKYVPPNSIGSITITPVTTQAPKFDPRHQASKLANNTVTITAGVAKTSTEPTIRVKSPAELMKAATLIAKEDKLQKSKPEIKPPNPLMIKPPENRSRSPLRIDTSYPKKPDAPSKTNSPGNVRAANADGKINIVSSENKLPRPGLVPVHHSPTFAKPAEKRRETKTKPHDGQVLIVTDVDPLSDVLQVDDSSSDVELVEDVLSKPPDPLSVPEPPKTDTESDKDSTSKNAQNPESSNVIKYANRELGPSAKRDKTDMRGEPDGSSVDDSSALGRIKDDYTHKHRLHKSDQSGSRPDHRSERSHHRDNSYVPAERTHKKDDHGHSDRSHSREGHGKHPDRTREESHSSKTHIDRDKRDLGPSEKRHRSNDRHSNYDGHRRDAETSDSQKKHHSQNLESHKREHSQRAPEYRSHVDKPPKKNDSVSSHSEKVPSRDESVHSHAKKPESEMILGTSRPEKRSEVEDEIAKVMRNLRDMQSLEPPFNGDIFGSSRNAVNRDT